MKLAGTIKLEVVKPLGIDWKVFAKRGRALSRALAPALNLSMREFYAHAVEEIDARRRGETADVTWKNRVAGALRVHWNSELARALDNDRSWALKNGKEEPDALNYVPTGDVLCGETVDHLLAQFAGDHLKDLLANKKSFPSFVGGKAFFSRARDCSIEGAPEKAVLRFPLWGSGKKTTALAVAPCGGNAKAMWRKLVHDYGRRDEVVALERAIKAASGEEKKRLVAELEEKNIVKLGRIGLKYDDKRNKWFALITWSQARREDYQPGRSAAVNLGVNVFLQALDEEGFAWDCPGSDVRVTRERFAARRRSIQRSLRFCGRGARGHGKKRFEQPLTKLDEQERHWMQTKNRTIAAELVTWCVAHKVSDLYLEDLTGIRESFEKQTRGEADTAVKRAIHSWAFFELGQAIERQCEEHHVRTHRVSSSKCSQRCPDCGHEAQENVVIVDRGGEYLLRPAPDPEDPNSRATVFKSVDKGTRFLCVACGHKGKGDMIACANMLVNAGKNSPLGKAQEKARARAVAKIKTKKGDKK